MELSFQEFVNESEQIVLESLNQLGYSSVNELAWLEPPDSTLGDLAFRVAFDLAKSLGKKPGEIASAISERSKDRVASSRYILSLEGHQSGFLNAKINLRNLAKDVLERAAEGSYGKIDLGHGSPVLIEHTSVNPNKALHVGHLRNVAIGDCLNRVFRFSGYDTYVLNYIDDSGLQVADIIVGFNYLGFPKESTGNEKYDHYAGDTVYVTVTKKYETDPTLREKQKFVLKSMESNDSSISKIRLEITDRILKEQLKTCWRFGARYDLFVYESDIIHSNLWSTVFQTLKDKGIAKYETEGKLAGCWIVSTADEVEGEDKVLVRSDGTATYVAKDIPFAALKAGVVSDPFSYSIYVQQPDGSNILRTEINSENKTSPVPWGSESLTLIDTRQARLQRIIQYILSIFSYGINESKYKFVGYAIISLSSRTASALAPAYEKDLEGESGDGKVVTMSGRHGTYVNADDAMDLVKSKALEETRKRNPEINDPTWFDNVAEKVAISALRFGILKQDLDKMIVFDSEESLKLIGETGPYLLYTYARTSSIISKLGSERRSDAMSEYTKLDSLEEMALIKTISKFSICIEKTVKNLAPKWLAHYSYSLCESFNSFYEAHRVLQEPDPEVRESRIRLIRASQNVLRSCLSLLGIEALERV